MYRTLAVVKGKKTELIREYQPVKRTIAYFDNNYDEYKPKPKTFLLQFPTMLFMWNRGRLHVAFTKKPIESLEDMVYCPPMGNIYDDWSVCGCSAGSLTGSIKKFWNSQFTNDGEAGVDALEEVFSGEYKNWKRIKTPTGMVRKINDSGELSFGEFMGFADLYIDNDEFNWPMDANTKLNLEAKYVSKFTEIIPKKRKRKVK